MHLRPRACGAYRSNVNPTLTGYCTFLPPSPSPYNLDEKVEAEKEGTEDISSVEYND